MGRRLRARKRRGLEGGGGGGPDKASELKAVILQRRRYCATRELRAPPSFKEPMRTRATGSSRWGGRSFTVGIVASRAPGPPSCITLAIALRVAVWKAR